MSEEVKTLLNAEWKNAVGSVRSSRNANVRSFVCLVKSVLIFLSQVSLPSVSGPGQSQVFLRSLTS